MKIVKLTLIGVTTLALAGPRVCAAAARAGGHCIVYENKNFDGITIELNMNQSVPALPESIDTKISSVRVRQGCILVEFADTNFKGQSETWGPGDYAMLPEGWNDVISSVQCNCRPQ
jgi:Beta/Gamma crystallin